MKNKQPIYYGNIKYALPLRGKKESFHTAKKMVMSGNLKDISRNKFTKRAVLVYHFRDKKRANSYDLSKIRIISCEFIKFLGYGNKSD